MAHGTTSSETGVLDDCIRMMRDCGKQCRGWADDASNPAAKAVLTCCATCCDAMARSCEEVKSMA